MVLLAWIVSFFQAIWNKVTGQRNAPGDNGLYLQQPIAEVANAADRDEETLNGDLENLRNEMRVYDLEREVDRLQQENTRLKLQTKEHKKYHRVCRRIDNERVQGVLREKRTLENDNSHLRCLVDDIRAVLRNTRRIAQCTQADGDNGTGNDETTLNRDLENDRHQMRVDQLQREVVCLQREIIRLKRQAKEDRKYHHVCRGLDSKRLQDVLHKKTALEDRVHGLEGEKTALEDRVHGLECEKTALEDRVHGLENEKTTAAAG